MIRLEYLVPGSSGLSLNSNAILLPQIQGKNLLSVYKDGVGLTRIIPTNIPYARIIGGIAEKHCLFNSDVGFIAAKALFTPGELVILLYQDLSGFCAPPVLQSAFNLPVAYAEIPYNASFVLEGTMPFSISVSAKPSWMGISISGSFVLFSGTPSLSDVGTETVAVTVNNACGSVGFSDDLDVTLLDAYFAATRSPLGTRLRSFYILNLGGTPGIIVNVKLTIFTNTNGGILKVNNVVAALNDSWNVILDSSGAGVLDLEIDGLLVFGTLIYGKFVIQSVSSGGIGLPDFAEISKSF